MPIFTYRCSKCSTDFERYEGVIQEEDALCCPECGSTSAEKIFSTFSVGKSSSGSSPVPPSCQGCPGGSCGIK